MFEFTGWVNFIMVMFLLILILGGSVGYIFLLLLILCEYGYGDIIDFGDK